MNNILLIGDGYWGQKIKDVLQEHPLIDKLYTATHDYKEYLADPSISHTFVATPVPTHYTICKDILISGKHLMCEKNFTQTYKEASELVNLAKINNLNIVVDYIHTFTLPTINVTNYNDLDWIKIEIEQYGRFRSEHVMSILGSHALSVLGTYFDISQMKLLSKYEYKSQEYNSITRCVTDWNIQYANKSIIVSIIVDLESTKPNKVRNISLYNDHGYCYNSLQFAQPNGLNAMINQVLNGYDNSQLALNVTKYVEMVIN